MFTVQIVLAHCKQFVVLGTHKLRENVSVDMGVKGGFTAVPKFVQAEKPLKWNKMEIRLY